MSDYRTRRRNYDESTAFLPGLMIQQELEALKKSAQQLRIAIAYSNDIISITETERVIALTNKILSITKSYNTIFKKYSINNILESSEHIMACNAVAHKSIKFALAEIAINRRTQYNELLLAKEAINSSKKYIENLPKLNRFEKWLLTGATSSPKKVIRWFTNLLTNSVTEKENIFKNHNATLTEAENKVILINNQIKQLRSAKETTKKAQEQFEHTNNKIPAFMKLKQLCATLNNVSNDELKGLHAALLVQQLLFIKVEYGFEQLNGLFNKFSNKNEREILKAYLELVKDNNLEKLGQIVEKGYNNAYAYIRQQELANLKVEIKPTKEMLTKVTHIRANMLSLNETVKDLSEKIKNSPKKSTHHASLDKGTEPDIKVSALPRSPKISKNM